MTAVSRRLDAGLHPKSVVMVTWWGNATVAIQSADRSIVIDPWVQPKEGEFQYIFCTHEHYAHADPETVEQLSRSKSFRRMFIARSCLYPSNKLDARCLQFLNEPHWQIGEYVIFYPKHYDHSIPRGAEGDTAELPGTGRHATKEEIASGAYAPERGTPRPFAGIDELWMDGWHIEGMEMRGDDPDVPYLVRGAMPQLGFFIEDLVSGVSLYHMGASRWTYSEMAEIRGRLDILFLPIGKMSREEEVRTLELTSPRCVIPIAWRDESEDYPIPKPGAKGADGERDELDFESPDDPGLYIRELTKIASGMGIQIKPLKAGLPYRV